MPTIDDLISKYRGGGQSAAATTPRATQIAQSTSTPASQSGTIDDLIAKFRPETPQSTGSTVHKSAAGVPWQSKKAAAPEPTYTPEPDRYRPGAEQPISFQQRMAMQGYEQSQNAATATKPESPATSKPEIDYTSEEVQKQKAGLKAQRDALVKQATELSMYGAEYTDEINDIQAQISALDKQISDLQKPMTFGEHVKSAGTAFRTGLENAGLGFTNVVEWALGERSAPWWLANEIATLLTGEESPLAGKNPVTALKKQGQQEVAYWQNQSAIKAAGNDLAQSVSKHSSSIAQSSPFILMNLMSLGVAGTAAAGTTEGLNYVSAINSSPALQTVSTIASTSLKNLATNPTAQYSFVSTFGSSYQDALDDGATESEATIYALLNAGFGTIVEMGGGLEAMPEKLVNALKGGNTSFALEYAKDIAHEIGEEEIQRVLELGLKFGYSDVEWLDQENPDSVFNLNAIGETAVDTAIDTAVMGGVQSAIQYGANAVANAAQPLAQQRENPYEQWRAALDNVVNDISSMAAENADKAESADAERQSQAETKESDEDWLMRAFRGSAESDTSTQTATDTADAERQRLIGGIRGQITAAEGLRNHFQESLERAESELRAAEDSGDAKAAAIARTDLERSQRMVEIYNDRIAQHTQRLEQLGESAQPAQEQPAPNAADFIQNLQAQNEQTTPTPVETAMQEQAPTADARDAIQLEQGQQAAPIDEPRAGKGTHIDDRNSADVGSLSVKAFQYDNPEVRPFYKKAAEALLNDLQYSIGSDVKGLRGGGTQITASRLVRDGMKNYKLTRAQMIDACNRIIHDEGQENAANAKRVELLLDRMLTEGYEPANKALPKLPRDNGYVSLKANLRGETGDNYRLNEAVQNEIELAAWDGVDMSEDEARAIVQERYEKTGVYSPGVAAALSESDSRSSSKYWPGRFTSDGGQDIINGEAVTENDGRANEEKGAPRVSETLEEETAGTGLAETDGAGTVRQDRPGNSASGWDSLTESQRARAQQVVKAAAAEELGEAARQAIDEWGDEAAYILAGMYESSTEESFGKFAEALGEKPETLMGILADALYGDTAAETPQNRAQTMDADEGIPASTTTTERIVAQPQELNSRSTNTATQQTTQTAENSTESGASMPTRVRSDGESRERGFTRNVRTDENRAENLRKVLNQNRNTYRQISNKSTLAKAEEMFQNGDAEQTVLDALAKAESGQKLPPEMVPLSKMVADYLTLIGDTQAAADITARMAVQMTEAGQFTQAARILRGAPADTVMQTIQKALDKVNEDLKAKFGKRLKWKAELTDAEKALIKNADYTKSGEYERVYDTIAKRVGAEMPVTIGEKLTELRRVNMLLRMRTHVRNLIANVPTVPMRIMKDRLSGAIQGAFTKAGLMKQEDRTRTAIISKGSKNLAREYFKANKGEIQNMGEKWDMNKSLREYKRYFKDGAVTKALSKLTGKELHNAMETVRRATYKALEAEDAPFVRAAYIDALAQICEVKGVTSTEDITQEMHEFALQNAAEATYKADTVTAQIINKLKQSGKVPGAIADIIFPFTNTPANILKMTLDYSPVGFLKTAGDAWSGASTATAIDSFSKATVGTAIVALGMMLRAMGKITGDDDDDKNVAAFEKASGKSGRSVGGRFSYDWAQPVGSMIALGAGIWEAMEGQDDVQSALIDALYSAGDGILEMSLFQNITSILKGYGSPTENFSNAVINGLATQMVPGIASDIAKIMDGTVRSTYTDGNVLDKSWAQMKAMIPGLSKTLPASVDVRGNAVSRGTLAQRIIDTLLNPGTTNRGQPNDVDKEIAAIYELTGTASVVPKVVEKSYEIKDVNYTLTPKEREQFQKTMGKSYYAELEKIIGEKGYDDLSGEEKAYLMTMARKKALNDAKEEFAKSRGLDEEDITRSKWEDLDAGERTLYLVAKAETSSIFDKEGKVTSYEDLDKLLEKNGPYSKLSDKAREVMGTGTGMSRLDDMYEARGLGIKSETYYDAWSKYKELNEEDDKTAAAEELKTYINKMPGLSKVQKTWLTQNLNLYRVMPVETKTYDKFVGAGVKAESAETLAGSFRDINPVGDYKTVQNSQKYQAIASAKYLSDAEKWAAFFALMNSNTEKCEQQARRAKDNGYTYDYWAANSEYAVVKQQKGK